MTRIYFPDIHTQQLTSHQDILIEGKQAHYVLTVLRRKIGDNLFLFDGKNEEYQTVIKKIEKKSLWLSLIDKQTINRESPLNIHLIQGISKGERMDWVVQKATELGVSRITPVYTQHGAVSLNAERMLKKQEHWENIIISACEQCGRNVIPVCDSIQSFSEALNLPSVKNCMRWILHPNETIKQNVLNMKEKAITNIQLLIGPEGGFSESEIIQAQASGCVTMQLGPRVLRTETAAIAAIAALQAIWGDGFNDRT